MKQLTPEDHVLPRQALRMRFFWFLAGAGVNYLLISTPLHWLEKNTELHKFVIAALSVGCAATFFFFWNYFINFRTERRKRDALPRYISAVVCMWLLSSTLLAILKHFNARMAFSIGSTSLDLDIVATQFFLAGLKFFLYHKWVFPVPRDEPFKTQPRTDELGKAG